MSELMVLSQKMIRPGKIFACVMLLSLCNKRSGMGQQLTGSMLYVPENIVTLNVTDFLSEASSVEKASKKAVPVFLYSELQQKSQAEINAHVAEYIVTNAQVNLPSEWSEIDHEEITPYTWRWLDLLQVHANNDTTFASLRRPLWWLQDVGANYPGDRVWINMPEMGLVGESTVVSIRASQLDTRFRHHEVGKGFSSYPESSCTAVATYTSLSSVEAQSL